MSDERPHYRYPEAKGYRDLMKEAVRRDADALDAALSTRADPLASAQAAVNRRHRTAWMRDVTQRAREHGWNDDHASLIDLLSRSDLPRLYLPH